MMMKKLAWIVLKTKIKRLKVSQILKFFMYLKTEVLLTTDHLELALSMGLFIGKVILKMTMKNCLKVKVILKGATMILTVKVVLKESANRVKMLLLMQQISVKCV